jgi:N,N'-diacetyllegionaminate synthase
MSRLDEIETALGVLEGEGLNRKDITILHCNSEYPTPICDVNLRAMVTLRDTFGAAVGYSDHTLGIEVPIAATALGATVIEKHYTLDRNMEGPDHKASLTPSELKEMVEAIRITEEALGSPIKEPTGSERKNLDPVRKSIVASTMIRKGESFSESNLTCKRPGAGISPMRWDEIVGQTAHCDYEPDDQITI